MTAVDRNIKYTTICGQQKKEKKSKNENNEMKKEQNYPSIPRYLHKYNVTTIHLNIFPEKILLPQQDLLIS